MTTLRRKTATCLALMACAVPAAALEPGFSPGEQIDFSVEYLSIRTAEARITVGRPEGAVWPVICQARTDGIAKFLDIREHLVAYWDAAARRTRGSDLSAIEIGDRHVDTARYDRDQGKATVKVQRKGRTSVDTYEIPHDVHDLAGAVLWLRLQPLEAAARYEIPVFSTQRIFTLRADVLGHERLETPAGTFQTVKVQVRTGFEGNFSTKRDTFVWFSDDSRHVPVRLSAEFAVGSLVATVTAYRAGGELAQR
jgi:Protein of unknown function (DUF3108)